MFKKDQFVFNANTLRYEKVERTWKYYTLRAGGLLAVAILLSFSFAQVWISIVGSPKEKKLEKELAIMKLKNDEFREKIALLDKAVTHIKERDSRISEVIFGVQTIDDDIWKVGVGGSDKDIEYTHLKYVGKDLATTSHKIDNLQNRVNAQFSMLDTLEILINNREKFFESLPSISPVDLSKCSKKDISIMSGFGPRLHPILKKVRMHDGIDFGAPKGTEIYASGNGVVSKVVHSSRGYGNYVEIDHGYGYMSRYAHMSAIKVKKGQKINRWQVVGLIGSTGRSTAPHLHYEVHKNGKAVDPVNFCMEGLTPSEYREFVNNVGVNQSSFD